MRINKDLQNFKRQTPEDIRKLIESARRTDDAARVVITTLGAAFLFILAAVIITQMKGF